MSNDKFVNLCLEGGGVKGIAYGGALEELHNRGVLSNIKRVAGTSAGAITAVLLAVGYSYKEVSDIVAGTNFNNFADDSYGFVRDAKRFIKDYGWHKGDYFRKWIGRLIKAKCGKKNLTFAELKAIPGKLELFMVATNLSDQIAEIFSWKHTPDMEIRDAARMSMSIPLFFKCVRYGEDKDIMVDGGVSWNYPLNIFDNEEYLENSENGEEVSYNDTEGYVFNHETLGFRLDSKKEIEANRMNWANAPVEVDGILGYASALVGFMLQISNKRHLHKNDWRRTIFIDTLDVSTTDFDISTPKINVLIEQGIAGAKAHLDWREAEYSEFPK